MNRFQKIFDAQKTREEFLPWLAGWTAMILEEDWPKPKKRRLIKKAIEAAKKSLIRVPLIENTVPHQLIGKFGAGRVLVKPASQGTGVIAGGAVRAVMQAVGVHDVRTKVLGSTNPHNVVRATFDALLRMKDPMELARLRGKQVEEI